MLAQVVSEQFIVDCIANGAPVSEAPYILLEDDDDGDGGTAP